MQRAPPGWRLNPPGSEGVTLCFPGQRHSAVEEKACMLGNCRTALPAAAGVLAVMLLLLLAGTLTHQEAAQPLAAVLARVSVDSRPVLAFTRGFSETGTIQGTVWNDADGDGLLSAGELPLAGALLTLAVVEGTAEFTRTTESDGWYLFGELAPASYELTETDPPGYISTTSNQLSINLNGGVTKTINFGDRLPPTPTPTPPWGQMQPVIVSCGATVAGDTRDGVALVDRYSCRPHWDESGPEQVYLLELSQPQEVTAVLSPNPPPQADLDLFLLDGPDPAACLAAGESSLGFNVASSGQYYLVVDGYMGEAGPYVLRIYCPLDPQATVTPTSTATPTPTSTPTPTITPTPTVTPTPTATVDPFIYGQSMPLSMHGWPPLAPPLSLTVQQGTAGYVGVRDTYLSTWEQTGNFADDEYLLVRSHDVMAPLLRFDLSLLPREAVIAEAILDLHVVSSSNPNSVSVAVHNVKRSWSVTSTTWLQAGTGVDWEEPGCNGASDRYLTVEDEQTLSETGAWYGWDVTRLAQMWTTDPALNQGVVLKGTAVPHVEYRIYSSDTGRSELRPRLEISYWVPATGQ